MAEFRDIVLNLLFNTGDPSNVDMDFTQCENQNEASTSTEKTPATYTDLTIVVDQATDSGEILRQKEMIAYELETPATIPFN